MTHHVVLSKADEWILSRLVDELPQVETRHVMLVLCVRHVLPIIRRSGTPSRSVASARHLLNSSRVSGSRDRHQRHTSPPYLRSYFTYYHRSLTHLGLDKMHLTGSRSAYRPRGSSGFLFEASAFSLARGDERLRSPTGCSRSFF
jgi:hypothetical protein